MSGEWEYKLDIWSLNPMQWGDYKIKGMGQNTFPFILQALAVNFSKG